jgi:mannosyl-3-phosphoglycerate phosphatase
MRTVVFSDVDGTLLDQDSYSWSAAKSAVEHLKQRNIPCVLVTSKTRAEVERLREQMGNNHPFIVENGGAAFVPRGYFPFQIPGSSRRDPYEVSEFGTN